MKVATISFRSMTEYINWDGEIVNKNTFYVSPDSRALRYGDGFFETMKVNEFIILLEHLHFERLFLSLDLLQFDIPSFYTPLYFQQQIERLLHQNNHSSLARVRLMFYRGDGGVYGQINNDPNFIIQSWPLQKEVNELNTAKLEIGIFKDARKVSDKFSSVKSNNFLCYIMAAFFVTKNKLHDALILNPYNRIADATIANIFIVQNGIIKTPSLAEGCISGVYRKYLLQSFSNDGIPFIEGQITIDELLNASEVFLTNAINGIKWIYKCRNSYYLNEVSVFLHNKYGKL